MTLAHLVRRDVILSVLLFGLVGPFVGALAALAFGCAVGLCADAKGPFLDVLPPVFLLAYLIGAIPACLTGIAMAFLARRPQRRAAFLLKSLATGGALAALCFGARLVRETSLVSMLLSGYGALFLVAAIGALASLVCTGTALSSGVLRLHTASTLSQSP